MNLRETRIAAAAAALTMRTWSVIRALCAQGLHGNLQLADAKSIGPDDAHTFLYGGAGCWEHFSKSAGPRPTAGAP